MNVLITIIFLISYLIIGDVDLAIVAGLFEIASCIEYKKK